MNLLLNNLSVFFRRYPILLMSFLLTSITLVPYWQVLNSDFTNFDDPDLIINNPYINKGMTWEGLQWASSADLFSDSPHSDFWIPATLLSHMITAQIFGMSPWGHHLVNLILHLLSTLLLFLILHRMTGALWRSAFVAALFSIHPLHVESVAWVTERKDVLSGFFFFLTLLLYIQYIDRPNLNRYLLVVITFTLGLMSKPMLVTLPFVLLLLDYWPLNRISLSILEKQGGLKILWKLTWEKFPLFLLTIVFSFTTYLTTGRTDAIASLETLPLWNRLVNALDSYATYIHKMVWPIDLTIFYPHPTETIAVSKTIGWFLLFFILTWFVMRRVRKQPYLGVGWFWYLGMLVPVIGLLQAGSQRMADRYTYLPLIGLFIIITWAIPDLLSRLPYRKAILITLSGSVLLILTIFASRQVSYWHNNVILYEHALKVTEKNYLAHTSLGIALFYEGEIKKAISHYYKSIQIRPDYVQTHYALGVALNQQGDFEEAMSHFSKALEIKPNHIDTQLNLGLTFFKLGNLEQAIRQFSNLLTYQPDNKRALYNLALGLSQQGKTREAIVRYHQTLSAQPDFPGVHNNLGNIYMKQEKFKQAIEEFELELELNPKDHRAHNNLGISYNEVGRLNDAILEYKKALEIKPNYSRAHYNLGNAYFKQTLFNEAILEFKSAITLEPNLVHAYHNLGTVYVHLGRLDDARKQYEEAIRIRPDFDDARRALLQLKQ